MSAAPARSWFRADLAQAAFRRMKTGEDAAPSYGHHHAFISTIKNVLSNAGSSLTQLSASTGRRYGTGSRYFVPPTFLHKLRSGITPHICQIVALSENTDYRFADWMKICGFDLKHISRLQMRLHNERTVVVTPADSDQLIKTYHPFHYPRLDENWQPGGGRYLLAKIGRRDAATHPQLVPGTILRVDRCYRITPNAGHDLLWLVELPCGLSCCRLRWIDERQIVLLPSRPPWGNLPLRLPMEARVIGLMETGSGFPKPTIFRPAAESIDGEPVSSSPWSREKMTVSDLLRISRRRTGLTFRAAHRLTVEVAQILANRDYGIGLGLLSDYEAMAQLPRHIAKIFSLCIAYCIDIRDLLEAAEVRIDDSEKLPLPVPGRPYSEPSGFLDGVEHCTTIGIGAGNGQHMEGRLATISRV